MKADPIAAKTFTGASIEPNDVKVYDGATLLTKGDDYTLEYGENIKAGNGTVIIRGKKGTHGNYGGSKTVKFTIVPKWLEWLAALL